MPNIREITEGIEKQTLSPYATLSADTKGRAHKSEKCSIRTEYQRDRDKIIHSKSFRRLKHKTQVFITPQGDHYRTRLTHTLEVSQIARTIARALRLNEDLVEAMSLAHDLGHTPFGHRGEYILNNLCPSGFTHYEQSLRVVDILEDGKGLNLTWEVRNGIIKHTGNNMASTLEGIILKYADRFAYINHDIDDAIRANILSTDSLPKECIEVLGAHHSQRINTLINDVIAHSQNKNKIAMSPTIEDAMLKLRAFMFEHVYDSTYKKDEEEKAGHIVTEMYHFFIKNPHKMPDDYKPLLNHYEIERVVCDYIASMSDSYAIRLFADLFVPKGWTVM